MATRGPKIPGARFSEKNVLTFLKFIGPVKPRWVLQLSEIMHMVSTEHLLARSIFTRSIKVLGWESGAPKIPGAQFSQKKCPDFLKFIGPVTPLWVLQPSHIMHMVSAESLRARAVFARSNKVSGWQPGAPKPREHGFLKKKTSFFEIHRTSNTSMGSVSP